MEYSYIVLTNSGTIPGRAVQRMTRFPYGHALLSFTPDCAEMYSFGRKRVHNFLVSGFVTERRDGAFFTYFSDTTCLVLRLPATEEQYARLHCQVAQFLANPSLYKYDFGGLFLRYFRIRKTFSNRYVCSHFVAEMLQQAGICRFPQGTCLVRPGDFAELPQIEQCYEGKLSELPRNLKE